MYLPRTSLHHYYFISLLNTTSRKWNVRSNVINIVHKFKGNKEIARMGCWGKYFNLRVWQLEEAGKNCIMRSYMICTHPKTLTTVIKLSRIRWAGPLVCVWRRWEKHAGFWLENLKARKRLEDIDIDERIILKWILKLSIDMDWIYSTGNRNKCLLWMC